MTAKIKRIIYLLLCGSIIIPVVLLFTDSVIDKREEDYGSVSSVIETRRIERFEGWRNRDPDYYEFALYFKDHGRFYYREPVLEDLFWLLREIGSKDDLTVHFHDEVGRNGGRKIVSIRHGNESILSFEQVQSRELARATVMISLAGASVFAAMIFLIIGRRRMALG